MFNFQLISPDSAAAGPASQCVIKSTENDLGVYNCWKLIWRKPNFQRFLEIGHVMSMSSHTSVSEILVYIINMTFTVIFQSAQGFEEEP